MFAYHREITTAICQYLPVFASIWLDALLAKKGRRPRLPRTRSTRKSFALVVLGTAEDKRVFEYNAPVQTLQGTALWVQGCGVQCTYQMIFIEI